MANDERMEGMTDATTEALPHTRYAVSQVVAHVIDPYSGKKKMIVLQGAGTLLIEPVMRNTEFEDNKAKKFDGNQAGLTFQVMAIKEDVL